MSKLGFADAVRADGDMWRHTLACGYLGKKGAHREFDAALMSSGGLGDEQREAFKMKRLVADGPKRGGFAA